MITMHRARSKAEQTELEALRVLEFMRSIRPLSISIDEIAAHMGMHALKVTWALQRLNDEGGVYKKDGGWCAC